MSKKLPFHFASFSAVSEHLPRYFLPEDLEEGDVLLIRTGRTKRRTAKGGWEPPSAFMIDMAGLDATCLPWIHERKVAIFARICR